MKHLNLTFLLLFSCSGHILNAQDKQPENYLEFNDRKSIVHGVYLGITGGYGEIEGQSTYLGGLKIAYVANQQLEVGFAGTFLYSDQDKFNSDLSRSEDLIGAYGGLHLEPIFFGSSRVNLSFPLMIGVGAVGYIDDDFYDNDFDDGIAHDDVDVVFVLEPGMNLLFNVSRYLQVEAGVKYRLSSKIDLYQSSLTRIDGFSGGIGVKVGIFNMGRNRYKKNAL